MKIVILGAGFAGVYTAINLSKKLKEEAEITLVDVNNYHLFKPMLHEVGTGSVDSHHILQPIRRMMKGRRFSFVRGMVQRIDTENHRVRLCDDCNLCDHSNECALEEFGLSHNDVELERKIALDYDKLVVCLGGTPNYYGIEGAREHTLSLNRLEDADRVRSHVLRAFEVANRLKDPKRTFPVLTFAVVGAGPTGIELISDLHDWVFDVLPTEFRHVRRDQIRLYLIEAGHDILPLSPPKIREGARSLIQDKSISVLTGSPVIRVGKDFVDTREQRIDTYTTIWTAGVKGNDILRRCGLPLDRTGRILVDGYLQAKGMEDVFAAGDCAVYTPPGDSQPLPQTGQVAVQEANYLVRRIHATIQGKTGQVFRYRDFGSALSAGRHQGFASFLGFLRLRGIVGWLLWKVTYLKHLVGIRLSFRSLLDWFMDITYDREAARHKI